jgi:peptidoglycan biosynthesis protein MviN/MurJ (putative lipid II flippase)
MITVNAFTDWLFGMWFGAAGIALSTTAAVTVGTIMDGLLVRKFFRGEVRTTPPYPLVQETIKTVVAVIPVIGVALLGKSWIGAPQTFVGMTARLLVVCVAAALLYMAASAALHIDGWRVLLGRLRRRIPSIVP